ncbi:MarR family winged helix-turn-helix transcriptional regulator [Streptomyces sp. NBC_00658]|uniref:MarR family winged helix-turn-helix transcriptional regulator n=1 Tax=Streptomyces sp. NBC_00658 TaxID=2975800 RepID=UPI0032467A1B
METDRDPIEEIHQAIVQFTRSTRTQSNDMYQGLSFVAFGVLTYVDSTQSPHAKDLADAYGLDKSTVSRQLAELEAQGLLLRVPAPHLPRAQLLKLTPKGRRRLRVTRARQQEGLRQLFGEWAEEDVAVFGRLLARFVGETGRSSGLPELPPAPSPPPRTRRKGG